MSVCANCRYFDKTAYPKNPHFGRCTYPLPLLPRWFHTAHSTTMETYRAVAIGQRNCDTHESA